MEFYFQQIKTLQLDAKINNGSEYYVKGPMSSVSTQLYITVTHGTSLWNVLWQSEHIVW